MTVTIVALALLALRLITVSLVILVLARQFKLFKLAIDTGLVQFRAVMFALGVVFFLGNFIPIMVDFYYAFINTDASWNWILILYATSNAVGSFIAAFILWKIYKIAGTDTDDSKGV